MRRARYLILAVLASALVAVPVAHALKVKKDPPPPSGQVGVPYFHDFEPDGGVNPYFWRIHSGSFPPGLTLSSSDGTVTGTPTQAGEFQFYIELRSGSGALTQGQFKIAISAKLTVTTGSLPEGGINAPYPATQLTATGGTVTGWSLAEGVLPTGMELTSGGVVQGTPTQSGTFSFVVRVNGAGGLTDTKRLSLFVAAPLVLGGPTGAPYAKEPVAINAKIGTPFAWGIKAQGGRGTYTYSSTPLPAGLVLNADGTVTGTPTFAGQTKVTYTVTDGTGQKDTLLTTMTVKALLAFAATATPPPATVDVPFSWKIPVSGASKRKVFLMSGAVPPGLSLNETTGVLSGTPLVAKKYKLKVWVLGDSGTEISKTFTITVSS